MHDFSIVGLLPIQVIMVTNDLAVNELALYAKDPGIYCKIKEYVSISNIGISSNGQCPK